ncbi:TPA: phage baseplate assembly protein V [Escherichia coli]|nr:phage baseplate assembly protein V [Escherichia coli]
MERVNDSALNRLLTPLMRRVRLMLARAVVNVINDGRKVQNLQVGLLDDEESDEVERLQNYGHFSVPLSGAEALIACVGAQRDQGIAVVVEDRRYRPTNLEPGDAGIYHHEGHRIRLTKDGRCIITCKTVEVYADESMTVDTPRTTFTGDVEIQKGLGVKGKSQFDSNITAPDAIINGKSTDKHIHRGDSGGTTGPMQ